MLYDLMKNISDDPKSLEQIIERFEPKIKSMMRIINQNDKEDLAQDVKLRLIKNIRDYDIDSIPSIWEIEEKELVKIFRF